MAVRTAWIPAMGTFSVKPSNNPLDPTLGESSFEPLPPGNVDTETYSEKMDGATYPVADNIHLEHFLNVASLANLAYVYQDQDRQWIARGDPTEVAIQVFACRFNWSRMRLISGIGAKWITVAEFPFDSEIKKMSVIFRHTEHGQVYIFTKGAVEKVIISCSSIYLGDRDEPSMMTETMRQKIFGHMDTLAAQGLR